jgi:thiamine pyrophosphokinase
MPAEEALHENTVIVVAGGGAPRSGIDLPQDAVVVAADEGIDRAHALGLTVDVAVGDFDSVSPAALATAEAAGARIERHPEAKDATDLELALDVALELDPQRILVLGGDAGRLDHLLAALLLLGSERFAGVQVDALLGPAAVHVIRGKRTLNGVPDELVSLLPLHGAAGGVTTTGLRYPLAGEQLAPGTSRGVSNVFAAEEAKISLDSGVLLAVRPGLDGKEAT